ncbi:nuclear transport factor 2 family protein [Mucilaginibacter gilvus]|uniref:Nuclear transport factor 2 family protein n=1 Tax=Mucilaginibacter gilvus TaxID=2305909 RepID=A0A444MI58_9SPHI|nr:nuclear transport factor 2 family protein [Mucilaginibacter gilvus]RWY47367.1 nuclear transport factor 2 family protein [Mucilaginibacter gilvus]
MENQTLTPIETIKKFLDNTTNPDVIRTLVATDATYISLNYSNPDLEKIMPWCGTKKGVESFVKNFEMVWQCWTANLFDPTEVFGSGENVAVFGTFNYTSNVLKQTVNTPFSIFAKVKEGKIYHFQFMEDTLATSASFRIGGAGKFQTFPGQEPFDL